MHPNNKFLQINFDDLDISTQTAIATKLQIEVCKHMRTPPISDPCADPDEATASIENILLTLNPTICELDLQELGEEAGILK